MEAFGIDESWIELTGSHLLQHQTPLEIANEIRETVKSEVGLTVSIGVSFNKIFAKLGSDMKKPDAVTVITPESFRDQVWPLPVSDILYVGRATTEKLRRYGDHDHRGSGQERYGLYHALTGQEWGVNLEVCQRAGHFKGHALRFYSAS